MVKYVEVKNVGRELNLQTFKNGPRDGHVNIVVIFLLFFCIEQMFNQYLPPFSCSSANLLFLMTTDSTAVLTSAVITLTMSSSPMF